MVAQAHELRSLDILLPNQPRHRLQISALTCRANVLHISRELYFDLQLTRMPFL